MKICNTYQFLRALKIIFMAWITLFSLFANSTELVKIDVLAFRPKLQRLQQFFLTIIITLTATTAWAQSPAPDNQAPEKVRLQLKWFNQFQFAGYYAAIEQGYYAEEGLDVEIKERILEKNPVKQVVSVEAEYGVGDSSLLMQYAQGEPVVAVAAIFQHSPLVFFSRQDSGILSPNEIKGKLMMSDIISANEAPLRAMLSGTGISDNDFALIALNNNYNLLVEGEVDLISGYLTDQPFFYKEKGLKINIINPKNYGIDFYGDILFTSRAELKNHPDRVDRFRRASLKGWRYALNHSEELIQIIHKKYNSKLSIDHLRFEAVETKKLILPDIIPLGTIETARIKLISNTYAGAGFNRPLSDVDLATFIYTSKASELKLTESESAWLSSHPVIRVGIDRDFAPYEWIDKDGQHVGMAVEYMHLLEEKLGLHFEFIKDKSRVEILNMAKRGELDMLSFAVKTPSNLQYLTFSKPYKASPNVIIDHGNGGFIGNLDNLAGKRVAIEKDYYLQELLQQNYPKIQLIMTSSTSDALSLVEEGKAVAYVGDAGSANYAIKKEGLVNLRFSGQTDFLSQYGVAIVKKHPELNSIINKALISIPEYKTDAIYNRWLGLNVEQGINPKSLIKYGLMLLLMILLFSYWAYRMRREIIIRKAAEQREQSRSRVLEMLTTQAPLAAVLEAIVKSMEQLNPSMQCSIMLLDNDGKRLERGVAPSLPDFYNTAMNGVEIGSGVGSCGTAAATGERVIVEDISTHAYWASYKDLAAKAGLASCWSQPILSTSGQVLGTFAIYHAKKQLPSQSEIELIEQSAALTSIAIEMKRAASKLLESESRLSGIINAEPECIKIVDAKGLLRQMNPAGLSMIEAESLAQVAGLPVHSLVAPEYQSAFMKMHESVIAGQSVLLDFEVIGLKGGRRWMETHAVPMREANGEIVHLAVTRDITERKKNEVELRIAAIAFESQEGMIVTDANNIILRVNQAFCRITGYSEEEVIGKTPKLLNSGRQSKEFYAAMWDSINKTGAWHGEIWNRRKDGETYPELLTITAVKDAAGVTSNYVSTLIDITISKAASQEIESLAFYDPLTQLPNRRLLMDRLGHALATSARSGLFGALLFLDLDYFKDINDSLGHDIGDLLLQQVAQRLVTCVREDDTVARLGGDEFVVLLENLSKEELEAAKQTEDICNNILAALNQPYWLNAHEHRSTSSAGATLFNDHDTSIEALLKQADIAMYEAKESGRNSLRFFDPKMQEAIDVRHNIKAELYKAIAQQQFRLHYQIQVDKDGRPLGAEVLLRWPHPVRGMIYPLNFIALAEETGLIIPIGQWVLDTACAQLKLWEQDKLTQNFTLSINVSAKQFHQADFVTQVQSAVMRHAIKPARIKLEITESMLLENIKDMIVKMNALGEIGIRFELDDFGTGYSSLQYLKQLPLHKLKVDRSFIRDIAIDSSDRALVRTIITLAQSLDLEVIAEGVEDVNQLQFLKENGCNHYQGYLFGKPMPIDEFEASLR